MLGTFAGIEKLFSKVCTLGNLFNSYHIYFVVVQLGNLD